MAKINFIITAAFMFLIIASTSFADGKYQWKLADTEDGCQIYTSVVAGRDYIASKATCVIAARIEVIGMVLRDIANYPEWMQDCKETKILKVVDDVNDVFVFWFRQHITLLTDRDMVIKSKTIISTEKGQNLIFADATNEIPYDPGKGYVRMPSFHSLFILEWIDREHTRVTFMIDPDLGKGIPVGIANNTIKSTPFKTLKKMTKMVKLSKYVESAKISKYNKFAEEYVKAGHKQ